MSGSTNSAISYFSATCALGGVGSRSFWQRRRENLRYTELCTFGFISLEHRMQGKPHFEDGNPKWHDFDVHNRIRLWRAEAVRPRRGSRVRSLWRLGLLLVREGMLRPGAMRVLLRFSCDSFVPEEFSANGAPIRSSCVSPAASPLCCVATSSTGWHAPKQGARPLSWPFVARCLNASATRNQRGLGGVRADRRLLARSEQGLGGAATRSTENLTEMTTRCACLLAS